MKEVEVKIQIPDTASIIRTLESKRCLFSEPLIQRDMVFIPKDVPTVPVPSGTNVLRMRRQGSKSLFTLKRSDPGNHLSKLEHELEISNPDELEKIIRLLDFKLMADTTKTRRKCKIEKYEICVDEVKDLGSFLEIEEMTDNDPAAAQKEMLGFLSELGIDVSKRVSVGYDVLWVQKYGKIEIDIYYHTS